jgi:HEPN domain-containing protein
MTPLTREWVQKAEGDFASGGRDYRARKSPNYDSACFHSQQCAEKYMKAVLQELVIAFPKTHDLEKLMRLLPPDPFWVAMQPKLHTLSAAAVDSRYPGAFATKLQAREAIRIAKEVRDRCRHMLKLPAKK